MDLSYSWEQVSKDLGIGFWDMGTCASTHGYLGQTTEHNLTINSTMEPLQQHLNP
jgi:hypothetical protein